LLLLNDGATLPNNAALPIALAEIREQWPSDGDCTYGLCEVCVHCVGLTEARDLAYMP